jgi:steroid delta-isomerase-like uncharacterized protein
MADPATVARDYLESWNRRDFDHWRELFHPKYSYTGSDGVRNEGPEAGMAVGQMFATAFPDGKIEIKGIHVAGDTATVEFVGRGTHKGDLMGIAPTGKTMEIPVCTILDIKDGKITAEREYMDLAHIMQQLGVMPAAATA